MTKLKNEIIIKRILSSVGVDTMVIVVALNVRALGQVDSVQLSMIFLSAEKKKPVLKMIPTILFLYRYCYSNFHILMELEWLLKLYTCLFCFTHTHTKHQSWINCCAWMNHCVEMIQLSEWWFNYSFISCCLATESVFLKEWKIHWLTHKNSCFSSPTGIRKLL